MPEEETNDASTFFVNTHVFSFKKCFSSNYAEEIFNEKYPAYLLVNKTGDAHRRNFANPVFSKSLQVV